jgi:hypothetical protein
MRRELLKLFSVMALISFLIIAIGMTDERHGILLGCLFIILIYGGIPFFLLAMRDFVLTLGQKRSEPIRFSWMLHLTAVFVP